MNLPPDVLAVINKRVPRVHKKDLTNAFDKNFKRVKEEMIQEFLSHPVTVEILEGPSGSNISGTLGGVTNLFAFIGFPEGDDPIAPILTILQKIDYKRGRQIKNGYEFQVNLPPVEEVFKATPMPWATGRSWAKGIETGISGIGYLLSKQGQGRSGAAIQSKKKIRSGRFQNTSYLSLLFKKYTKKFNQLK